MVLDLHHSGVDLGHIGMDVLLYKKFLRITLSVLLRGEFALVPLLQDANQLRGHTLEGEGQRGLDCFLEVRLNLSLLGLKLGHKVGVRLTVSNGATLSGGVNKDLQVSGLFTGLGDVVRGLTVQEHRHLIGGVVHVLLDNGGEVKLLFGSHFLKQFIGSLRQCIPPGRCFRDSLSHSKRPPPKRGPSTFT